MTTEARKLDTVRALWPVRSARCLDLSRAYLAMRGIKTFPVRMERQCANACKVASWLPSHPAVDRVYFPATRSHPDAAIIKRIFAPGIYGAIVSFEVKGADLSRMFALMNRFRWSSQQHRWATCRRMASYSVMSSHRDLSPKHRARLGIQDNLLRLSVGIEAVEDIIADLDQALKAR